VKIYTRKGDTGETSIWAGRRLRKDQARVEAIGSVDECNAAVGLALASGLPEQIADMLASAQACLFIVGSELMAPQQAGPGTAVPRLAAADVTTVETAIDTLQGGLPGLRNFIVPGGTLAAAQLHLARTVCRRAERRVTTLRAAEDVAPAVPAYLNRLSDLLFVAARSEQRGESSGRDLDIRKPPVIRALGDGQAGQRAGHRGIPARRAGRRAAHQLRRRGELEAHRRELHGVLPLRDHPSGADQRAPGVRGRLRRPVLRGARRGEFHSWVRAELSEPPP
jgi:cob(I)alamin adenosyltransferase